MKKQFKSLKIGQWRQFQDVDINFHDRLTILTGANGAGKTTILNLLNRHWGWNINFISTPLIDSKGVTRYLAGLFKDLFGEDKDKKIGEIEYTDGEKAVGIFVPTNVNQTFNIRLDAMTEIKGVHVPSHRPSYVHQPVANIPITPPTKEKLYTDYMNEVRGRATAGNSPSQRTPNYYIKESLIALATAGYKSDKMVPNLEAREIFEDFQSTLEKVLPKSLGFQEIALNLPEVVLKTKQGSISLDSVSGGITAIIDLTWQIFTYSLQLNEPEDEFVVTIDEPENHLHPEMQKSLLKNFVDAFPKAQFIVATHNPFIVTSVVDSQVYALNFNSEGRVESIHLDTIDKAGSSNEILREVLGLSSTYPLWVEDRLNLIINKYSDQEFNNETLSSFRSEMAEIGLEKIIPESIVAMFEKYQEKNDKAE